MRLIDTDKLIEAIRNSDDVDLDVIEAFIDLQPTAYDVDKVVEELNYIEMKWNKTCPQPNEYGEPMCNVDCVECQIRRCKDVVKRGGVKR